MEEKVSTFFTKVSKNLFPARIILTNFALGKLSVRLFQLSTCDTFVEL